MKTQRYKVKSVDKNVIDTLTTFTLGSPVVYQLFNDDQTEEMTQYVGLVKGYQFGIHNRFFVLVGSFPQSENQEDGPAIWIDPNDEVTALAPAFKLLDQTCSDVDQLTKSDMQSIKVMMSNYLDVLNHNRDVELNHARAMNRHLKSNPEGFKNFYCTGDQDPHVLITTLYNRVDSAKRKMAKAEAIQKKIKKLIK